MPSATAEPFSSPLLNSEAPVVIRFSMAGGNPEADERLTQLWPQDRETVTVGRLRITDAGGEACDLVNFDPNRLASDDPVLALRSAAYAISQGKRLANQ